MKLLPDRLHRGVEDGVVWQAAGLARGANAWPHVPKSPKPATRDTPDTLLATCDAIHRGIRNRALLMLVFARSGAQRLFHLTRSLHVRASVIVAATSPSANGPTASGLAPVPPSLA